MEKYIFQKTEKTKNKNRKCPIKVLTHFPEVWQGGWENSCFNNAGWKLLCSESFHTTLKHRSAYCPIISYRKQKSENSRTKWDFKQWTYSSKYRVLVTVFMIIIFLKRNWSHFSLYWFNPQWLSFPSLTFTSSYGYFPASS